MHFKGSNVYAMARTSNLNEELGQVRAPPGLGSVTGAPQEVGLGRACAKLKGQIQPWARGNMGLPQCLSGKEYACNVRDLGSIPESGRCPGERNGNPLQYSCLENPRDRGAWHTAVHGVAKSWTGLSD